MVPKQIFLKAHLMENMVFSPWEQKFWNTVSVEEIFFLTFTLIQHFKEQFKKLHYIWSVKKCNRKSELPSKWAVSIYSEVLANSN